jgi:uncharacterized membrane protein
MGLSDTLKKSFVAGLALVAPLVVTFVAFRLIFGWLRGVLNPIIEGTRLVEITGNVGFAAEILALFILFGIIATLGYVAQRSLGAYAFDLVDRLIGRIPIVSVIYSSVRQVSDALVSQESRYESVALVEYPREGLYVLGFVTSESPKAVVDALGGDAYNVYLPNSPNPTQGHFTLVPSDQVLELDLSVSRAIRLIVTTGIAEQEEELEAFQQDVKEQLEAEGVSLDDVVNDYR